MLAKRRTYFDGSNICVLGGVLILIKSILGQFTLLEVDAKLDELEHHRLQGGDGTVSGSLGRDMFVQNGKGSVRLLDSDELLGSL